MATPHFKDRAIVTEDITTWPRSPDRDRDSLGRGRYGQMEIQNALKSNPSQKINLSEYNNFLETYEPVASKLYKKDPVSVLIAEVAEKNLFFEDDTFPPFMWWDGEKGVKKYGRIKELIPSPKLHVLHAENADFFAMGKNDDINFNFIEARSPIISDMNQRGLANCGFVATMGSLALHPQAHNLLFSSIYPAVYNPLGIYSVRLICKSEVRYILIDDQIPNEGYSSMQNPSEFWYLLIEKAFAKFLGGYSKLGGGMEDYLGMQSSTNTLIDTTNKNAVWDYFLDIFQIKHSTTYQGTGDNTKFLVANHAYSIIDAAEWSGIRLVRLHNPWNIANYEGNFSNKSADWNSIPLAIQKDKFQVDRFKQSTFWMPYDLYVNELPKISDIYLNAKIPNYLQAIANPNPIQD